LENDAMLIRGKVGQLTSMLNIESSFAYFHGYASLLG